MNIFSVLDTSDNEEEVVQKKNTKKTTKEEEKPQAKGGKAQPQAAKAKGRIFQFNLFYFIFLTMQPM